MSIDSNNVLSPVWRQAIISTNTGLLSIGPLGTNFSDVRIKIENFHLWKCSWKCRRVATTSIIKNNSCCSPEAKYHKFNRKCVGDFSISGRRYLRTRGFKWTMEIDAKIVGEFWLLFQQLILCILCNSVAEEDIFVSVNITSVTE